MNPVNSETHSFVVKIWLEHEADGRRRALWRGHVTHVPSGRRRYFQDLDTLVDFIAQYLEAMGVRLGLGHRLIRWFRRAGSMQDERP
ncbi:MAG: hypothetical protein Kow0047_30930 [Anaerolineae bacterium]